MAYENIAVETRGKVGVVTLDRPNALNALNSALVAELGQALADFDADDGIGAIVLTGSEKAFAAGADIKEMQSKSYMDAYFGDFIGSWECLAPTNVRSCQSNKGARQPVHSGVPGTLQASVLPSLEGGEATALATLPRSTTGVPGA